MKMKLNYIIIFSAFFVVNDIPVKSEFIISAAVERGVTINLDIKTIRSYMENLDIYTKNFPDMVNVKQTGDEESEWTYNVEYPLASAWNITFDQVRTDDSDSLIIFESKSSDRNYLYCEANLTSLSQNRTMLRINIKVKLTREKASDIHILAGILGEDFINSKMKNKLDGDLKIFIENICEDLYKNKM
jgi:hypothetical protein